MVEIMRVVKSENKLKYEVRDEKGTLDIFSDTLLSIDDIMEKLNERVFETVVK